MAARRPLVINGGQIEQLQSSDTLDAVVSEVDIVSKENDNAGAVVIGMAVYPKTNGKIDKARANAQGTVQVVGLVKDASISAAATGSIQTSGVLTATTGQWDAVTGQSGGLTAGSVYFLDPTTAGNLTTTAPTTIGQYVVRVGLALTSTEMDIDPQPPVKL